jgi:hypothetical protein
MDHITTPSHDTHALVAFIHDLLVGVAEYIPDETGHYDMAVTHPTGARFWFVMSIALCAGFIVALPMNWWLVDRGLKHGMMTVRDTGPIPQVAAITVTGATLPAHPRGAAPSARTVSRVRMRSSDASPLPCQETPPG